MKKKMQIYNATLLMQTDWDTEYQQNRLIHRGANELVVLTNLSQMTSKIFKADQLVATDKTPESIDEYTYYLLKIFS